LTIVFKLDLEAQKHSCSLHGVELIPEVISRVQFVDGKS
jgi:hypothetical protein